MICQRFGKRLRRTRAKLRRSFSSRFPPMPGSISRSRDFWKNFGELCDTEGSVLIFDEVMTGFRVAPGGAQELYGVLPDLTALGKVIGGGLPVGAFGGRSEIMDALSPDGPVYQAGTLSGNPIAMAAGLAQLGELDPTRRLVAPGRAWRAIRSTNSPGHRRKAPHFSSDWFAVLPLLLRRACPQSHRCPPK